MPDCYPVYHPLKEMMTPEELQNLADCYIAVEGYTDLRSILSVMSQEYPGEFDRRQAIQAIRTSLKDYLL